MRGAAASFSEFLIGEDMRPAETVTAQKFEALVAVLEANADEVPAALGEQLEADIEQIRQAWEQGLYGVAIDGIVPVAETILEASSGSLTALWRSGAAVNVAGELRSLLETLVFSLELQQAPPVAQPGDVNLDGRVDVGDVFFLIDQVFGDSPPPAGLFSPSRSDEQP